MKRNYINLWAVLVLAGTTFAATSTQAADGRALKLFKTDRTMIVGHRGFSMGAPENTIPSYEWAKLACADMVELDFYSLADGSLYCHHDGRLDRTTDSQSSLSLTNAHITSLISEQVKKLDAGSWKDPLYKGVKVPSLEEALTAIQANGGITLAEHKTGSAKQCIDVLKKLDCVNDLVVQSFNWNFLADMQKQLPEQVTVALGPCGTREGKKITKEEYPLDEKWIDAGLKLGIKGIAWNSQVSEEAVKYAHEKGLKVFVYTIDDIAAAQKFINMGVDVIITDNPALIWKAIATNPAKK